MAFIKKIKKHWFAVWAVVIGLSVSSFIGYTAYTRVTVAKRVISTAPGAGIPFSSNYMRDPYALTEEAADPNDYGGEGEPSHPFYYANVCNYAQGDKSSWYRDHNFKFTLKAQLVKNVTSGASGINYSELTQEDISFLNNEIADVSDDKTYQISYNGTDISLIDGTEKTVGTDFELMKDKAMSQSFKITFDISELSYPKPVYYIKLTAMPESQYKDDLAEQIVGDVGVTKSTGESIYWEGNISDQLKKNDETYYNYDAYNYVVQGNGAATLNVLYDSSKLKVSKVFLANEGFADTDSVSAEDKRLAGVSGDNWRKLTKTVTAETAEPRYEIQFYKTSDSEYAGEVLNYVGFYFN